ncbi:MAG: hypothetical protein LBI05_03930, partial [Planctomycetaceae bacterium]|nr:hypothetical protein [Planctomycetaceae bacterium]
ATNLYPYKESDKGIGAQKRTRPQERTGVSPPVEGVFVSTHRRAYAHPLFAVIALHSIPAFVPRSLMTAALRPTDGETT